MYKTAARILGMADQFVDSPVATGESMERIIIESVLKELAKRGMVAR